MVHRVAVGHRGRLSWVAWRQQRFAQCVWVHLHVWVHAGRPVCSLLAPGGTLQLLVHFKLILLMLSSFILLSLSVNLSFLTCTSYVWLLPSQQPTFDLPTLPSKAAFGEWAHCCMPREAVEVLSKHISSVKGRQWQRKGLPSPLCLTCPEECHQALCLHYALHCRYCFGAVSSYSLPCHFSAD